MYYLLFCFVCYGITVDLVYSTSVHRMVVRSSFLSDMLDCVKCTGFWVGVFVSFALYLLCYFNITPLGNWSIIDPLWAGFFSSGSCWLLDGLRKE